MSKQTNDTESQPTLTISVEGGTVTGVSVNVNDFPFDAQVIDYDMDDVDALSYALVEALDGKQWPATIWHEDVGRTQVKVLAHHRTVDGRTE